MKTSPPRQSLRPSVPRPSCRSIQIGGISTNGILRCKIKSFEKGPTYEIGVRLDNGLVHCTCPHFEYRCLKFHPTLWSPKICKHLAMYRDTLIKERKQRRQSVSSPPTRSV